MGTYWVKVNVVTGCAQITIAAAFHQLSFVPAAENVADELVAMVEPNSIGALQPGHSRHQIGVRGLQHQVVVIAHQTKGMNLPSGLPARLGQGLEEDRLGGSCLLSDEQSL